MSLRVLLKLLPVIFILTACSKEPSLSNQPRGSVVSVQEVGWLSAQDVATRVEVYDVTTIAEHNLKYFVVDYSSVHQGEPVDTRGLLILPEGVDTMDLMVYTHGTLIPIGIDRIDNQLASNYRGAQTDFFEIRNICLPIASGGFAVFVPDYIGFTNSSHKEHPYIYYPELFQSIIDGARAAKGVIGNLGFVQDNRLFLAGWSQGAGASLATHKIIERDHSDEFEVVASSGLAGPYNFTRFINFVFENQNEDFEYLNIYSWGVYCVNKFSGIKRPTDQLFSYPVYDQMSALLVPSKRPSEIFNMFFINRIVNEQDQIMVSIIADNSTHNNWIPQGKAFFHHGESDPIVPYFNSEDAYNGLSNLGGDVTLYSYPNGDHFSEVGNFMSRTFNDFNELK
jgi:hypothetical protein